MSSIIMAFLAAVGVVERVRMEEGRQEASPSNALTVITRGRGNTHYGPPDFSDNEEFNREGFLDHRPVVWSMQNHPEEWENGQFTVRHKPSKHEFWVANGEKCLRLYHTPCSCFSVQREYGGFSKEGRREIWKAYKGLLKSSVAKINEQFASHFVR